MLPPSSKLMPCTYSYTADNVYQQYTYYTTKMHKISSFPWG